MLKCRHAISTIGDYLCAQYVIDAVSNAGDFVLPYAGYDAPHKYPRGNATRGTGYIRWEKGRIIGLECRETTVQRAYIGKGPILSESLKEHP